VAITADDSVERRARCLAAGMAGFLGKGFAREALRAVLGLLPASGAPDEQSGGGAALGVEMRRMLRVAAPEHLRAERRRLDEALAAGRRAEALRALHALRGLAALCRAAPVASAAGVWEERLRGGLDCAEARRALDASLAAQLAHLDAGGQAGGEWVAAGGVFPPETDRPLVSTP
jgi:CheY-like chemotaxis protein